ncbi:MAG: menaquinone biosynthesis protein [Thermoguttaceae bacterium]|jgi:chorismate dehydratase
MAVKDSRELAGRNPTGPLRIGAVAYLNAQPLVYGLERLAPEARVVVDFPSRLADGLAEDRLDVAIVPSIEYLRRPGYTIVSDACIACEGPVRSVKLFSRVPLHEIRSLALDEGSRTSVALARILLKERFGLHPELVPLPLGMRLADAPAEAAVLIGDRAMREPEGDFEYVWDLGGAWFDWTGLPLVFALWVARPGAEAAPIGRILSAARDEGVGRLAEIARREAPVVGLPEADCLSYLRDHLRFHFGPRQRQGLARFLDLAVRHGLATRGGSGSHG